MASEILQANALAHARASQSRSPTLRATSCRPHASQHCASLHLHVDMLGYLHGAAGAVDRRAPGSAAGRWHSGRSWRWHAASSSCGRSDARTLHHARVQCLQHISPSVWYQRTSTGAGAARQVVCSIVSTVEPLRPDGCMCADECQLACVHSSPCA